MINIAASVTKLLAVLTFLDSNVNNELKQNKPVDILGLLKGEHADAIPILPGLLQFFSPKFHPPADLPLFPPIVPTPKEGTWIYNTSISPIVPDQDPFYFPPYDSYANLKNGEIIAIRAAGVNVVVTNSSRAYQISYRSESTSGKPTAEVTLVVFPEVYDGKTVLSFQSPEDARSTLCAPSYTLTSDDSNSLHQVFLGEGWVLNFPNYEGINSAFGAGVKAGKATLDSLRALKNAKAALGFDYSTVGLYGYSGGSIATGHALELQPSYAPEIEINAAALGGYVVNLTSTFETINGGIFAGFAPTGIIGLSYEYPEIANLLAAAIKPGYQKRFYSSANNCAVGNLVNFFGQDIFSYLQNGDSILYEDAVQRAFSESQLGQAKPTVPLLVFQGVQDEIAPVGEVDKVVDFYCRSGANVEYWRQDDLAHITGAILNNDAVTDFLRKAFAGYVPPQCSSYKAAITPTEAKTFAQLQAALSDKF